MLLAGTTAVAVHGRALLIEGEPGSGKSSLALALIDRGASLIGDDGVWLSVAGNHLIATPPPRIAGLLEVRGVGLVRLPGVSAPVALILRLDAAAPRLPDPVQRRALMGHNVPLLLLQPHAAEMPLRAEYALRMHGLAG
jgi:serine kinase of HPr protein (carbohydrate metabolism regulator)